MRPITALCLAFLSSSVLAADIITERNIGMEFARDLATEAVNACKENGFHVSAVVVDKHGNLRAALRDDTAAKFTLQIAEEKANAALMSGINSGDFREQRSDIRQEMNHVHGILMMVGGVPITAAGVRIGAIGVSGAPGGEKDEACIVQALDKLAERIEFAAN